MGDEALVSLLSGAGRFGSGADFFTQISARLQTPRLSCPAPIGAMHRLRLGGGEANRVPHPRRVGVSTRSVEG